jgi:hypothetical protein
MKHVERIAEQARQGASICFHVGCERMKCWHLIIFRNLITIASII